MAEEEDSRGAVFFPADVDSPGSYSLACGGERLGRPVGPSCTGSELDFLLGLEEGRELSEGDAFITVSADNSEHALCSFST